jgi:hypothetical protein
MKKVLIVVIIIAALVLAYFVLAKNQVKAPVEESDTTQSSSTDTTAGKLNIDVVCESALSYMTFPDADSADAFVAECKAGEHPEVIEHYKEQMNLGDDAAI